MSSGAVHLWGKHLVTADGNKHRNMVLIEQKYANAPSWLRSALLEANTPLRLLSVGPLGASARGPLWWDRALAPLRLHASCICCSHQAHMWDTTEWEAN